jgi:DNA-binding CsgD family transcriptional regulator
MPAEGLARQVERLPARAGDPDGFFASLVALLDRHGVGFEGACWHLTDPATGLFTWTGFRGELPGDFVSAIENEYLEDDVAKYAELATRRAPVATLLHETGGRPRRSARYRRYMVPDGFADELRLAFADGFGRWGSMGLFSERPFEDSDREAAAQLVPLVARALREGVGAASAAHNNDDDAPGVMLLDAADRVQMRDARAGELLEGAATTGTLPGAVHVLAARARAAGRSQRGRTLAGGAWIAIDVSPVVHAPGAGAGAGAGAADAAGTVTVVLRPAPGPSLLDVRLRAAALTGREREIARALLRGDDTAMIATRLHLSPWTVQDHLKSIFDKTGVRSRRAFVAHWGLASAGIS